MRKSLLVTAAAFACTVLMSTAVYPSPIAKTCIHGTVSDVNAKGVLEGFKITKLTRKELDNVLSHFTDVPGELDSAYVGTKDGDAVIMFGSHGCVIAIMAVGDKDALHAILKPNRGV